MAQETLSIDAAMRALAQELATHHLRVHQPDDPPLMTAEPQSTVQPHLWRWPTLERMIGRVSEVVPLERGGERRTLRLVNPGLPYGATHTLWASIQCILPGEVATAHRHSVSAFRFIIDGAGASTTVDGARYPMERGDLLLTPGWAWHDHRHDGTAPMVWLDGLDIPLVRALHAVFFQPYSADQQVPTRPEAESLAHFGAAGLRPVGVRDDGQPSALAVYKWPRTLAALEALAATGPYDPHDDVAFEYRDPLTGRPALPTIGLGIQMLRPGVHTLAHRHTSSTVYHVVRGEGATIIDGTAYSWSERDFLVVPPWAWHEHLNHSSSQPAILFQMNDQPTMQALGLFQEQAQGTSAGQR
ncbi:MAG TPA: cupin domain-containing protein [Chloroflexota bacterium]|nr:cupin domain-containing protein [Chloroflexota bacterium]